MMKRMPKLSFQDGESIRAYRKKHDMNQSQFWSRVGVTQSGGSRYESGRNIPKPVQLLLTVTYGTDAAAGRLVEYLRGREG